MPQRSASPISTTAQSCPCGHHGRTFLCEVIITFLQAADRPASASSPPPPRRRIGSIGALDMRDFGHPRGAGTVDDQHRPRRCPPQSLPIPSLARRSHQAGDIDDSNDVGTIFADLRIAAARAGSPGRAPHTRPTFVPSVPGPDTLRGLRSHVAGAAVGTASVCPTFGSQRCRQRNPHLLLFSRQQHDLGHEVLGLPHSCGTASATASSTSSSRGAVLFTSRRHRVPSTSPSARDRRCTRHPPVVVRGCCGSPCRSTRVCATPAAALHRPAGHQVQFVVERGHHLGRQLVDAAPARPRRETPFLWSASQRAVLAADATLGPPPLEALSPRREAVLMAMVSIAIEPMLC